MIFELIAVGALALGLRHIVKRIDSLSSHVAAVASLVEAADHENRLQHKIDRRYIGFELLEQRLLPHVGWQEPTKPELVQQFEQRFKQDLGLQEAQ